MSSLQQFSTTLFPYRWKLFAVAMVGLVVSVALIFLAHSAMGFALVGPLVCLPWGLMCVGRAKNSLVSAFFLVFAFLGIAWPVIVLLG